MDTSNISTAGVPSLLWVKRGISIFDNMTMYPCLGSSIRILV